MNINKDWHLVNRMPKNSTPDQRVKWHIEHVRNCTCRPLGGKILEEIRRKSIKV